MPKNGKKWRFFRVFRAPAHRCTWTASGGARPVARRRGSAIVRALVGSAKEERHSRSWFRYQLLYDRTRAAERVESQRSTDVPFAEGLTRAKKSGPAHFVARRGRSESVHPGRRGRGPGQDQARHPAGGENTMPRDATEETSRQDQVKLARSPDPSIAQPLSRGNPFVDGVLLGATTAVAHKTRPPTRSRSTGSSQRSWSRPTPRSSTHDCGRKYRASGDRCGTEPERTGEYDPCGSRTWMPWRPSAGHYDPCLVFGIRDGLRNR